MRATIPNASGSVAMKSQKRNKIPTQCRLVVHAATLVALRRLATQWTCYAREVVVLPAL